MKHLFLLAVLFFGFSPIYSQSPQIALVKPNGTTTIHTTGQSAYDASTDGDYIYFPGGVFYLPQIEKRLYIYGAGAFQDSSVFTGITELSIVLLSGSTGGSLEGMFCPSLQIFGNCSNYTISNCILNSGIYIGGQTSNVIIKNNLIKIYANGTSFFLSTNAVLTNSFLKNNIILGNLNYSGTSNFNEISNNLFFTHNAQLFYYCTYNNNIFINGASSIYSTFNNNSNVTIQQNNGNIYNNNITEDFSDSFISPGSAPYTFTSNNDYHVKSTSLCKNSGTNGTDRGIYGGIFQWVEGLVPSNPHIYFKNVAEETNASGQLQIHFKVRTGN